MNDRDVIIDSDLTMQDINDLEESRLQKLADAGIDEQDVLGMANENQNNWQGYFNENITRGKDDQNFLIRDQWTALERSEFNRLFKPAMTVNKLKPGINKIVGEQRKNQPDLIVRSITGNASQEQLDLRANLLRTIAYQSSNHLVYQIAFRSALSLSFGAFQVALEYETPKSFKQVPRYLPIVDPTRCAWDPTALMPHKGDGNYCSRTFEFSKQEFFATYPYISNPVSYNDQRTALDFQWQTKDSIMVCDYFVKEWYSEMIYKLSNGLTVTADEWEDMQDMLKRKAALAEGSSLKDMIMAEIPTIKMQRQTQDYKIMHYRLVQNQIIEFSEWPSKQLPILFVDGDSYYIDGRQYTQSYIHEARDTQKFINFIRSESAGEIKNRRREQWIGTADNIVGEEQMWRNPEQQLGILIAKPDSKTGLMPQKMPPWELSQTLLQQYEAANVDLRELMGATEGNNATDSRDISGVAKKQRRIDTSLNSYNFFDNLNQAIAQSGRVVMDLLPVIAGSDEMHFVSTKSNGNMDSIIINKREKDGSISNTLEGGEYDIEIDTGPSFAVQQDESLQLLTELCKINPGVFPLVADYLSKNLDLEFAPQISERFKSLVPPDILAKEEGKEPPPKQPNPQEQAMQAQMQLQQQEMKIKEAELQIKAQKLQIEKEKNQLDQAELMLKAHKDQNEMQLDVYNHHADIEKSKIAHGLDQRKTEHDFSAKIAGLLSDLHKHEAQHKHEKELAKMKPKPSKGE